MAKKITVGDFPLWSFSCQGNHGQTQYKFALGV
jgi:hypothetical protein